jgi:hypothetical protein
MLHPSFLLLLKLMPLNWDKTMKERTIPIHITTLVERAEVEHRPKVAGLLDDGKESAAETSCHGGLYCFLVE